MTLLSPKPEHLRLMSDARKRHPDVWCYEDKRGLEVVWSPNVTERMAVLPVRKIRAYLARLDAGEPDAD